MGYGGDRGSGFCGIAVGFTLVTDLEMVVAAAAGFGALVWKGCGFCERGG